MSLFPVTSLLTYSPYGMRHCRRSLLELSEPGFPEFFAISVAASLTSLLCLSSGPLHRQRPPPAFTPVYGSHFLFLCISQGFLLKTVF